MAGAELFPDSVRQKVTMALGQPQPAHAAPRPCARGRAYGRPLRYRNRPRLNISRHGRYRKRWRGASTKRRQRFTDVLMGNGACNSHADPTYARRTAIVAFWWHSPTPSRRRARNWDRHRTTTRSKYERVARICVNLDDETSARLCSRRSMSNGWLERETWCAAAVRMGAYIPRSSASIGPHRAVGKRAPPMAGYRFGSSTRQWRRHSMARRD